MAAEDEAFDQREVKPLQDRPSLFNSKPSKVEWIIASAFSQQKNDRRKFKRPTLVSTQSAAALRKEFAQKTSCHGFGRTVDREEPRGLRLFWTLAIVVLSSGLLVSVFLLSYDTFVVRSIRRDFSSEDNDTMYLPDVHICDASLFNRSVLEELGFNDTMASYLALTLSPILASHSATRNENFRTQLKDDFGKLMEGKTLEEVFDKAVLKCEDIIFRCVHDTARYDGRKCCQEIFGGRRFVTFSAAMCLSTHNQPRMKEIFPSQAFGLTIYLRTRDNSFKFDSKVISTSVAARRGIMYAVSDEITALHSIISVAGHYTWPGTWTSAAISLTRTDNTELLSGVLSPHGCVPRNSDAYRQLAPGFDVYSRRNCLFASSTSWLQQLANCSVFRLDEPKSGDRKKISDICHPDMMIESKALASLRIKEQRALSSLYSSCPEDCIVDEYHLSPTTAPFDFEDIDEFQSNPSANKTFKYSAIHFFYPSFCYSLIKNHPGSLVKWISDVGGNMSLFIGASLVTLMELFVLIFRSTLRF